MVHRPVQNHKAEASWFPSPLACHCGVAFCPVYRPNLYMCLPWCNTHTLTRSHQMRENDDGTNESSCFRMASYLWVFAAFKFTDQRQHGIAMLVEQLRSLRVDLHSQIERSSLDVEENRKTVCTLLERGAGRRDVVVVRLLKKSIALKKVRDGFLGRVGTIELQIDALENSDFNRNMLQTMQSTTDAMRKMGLDKGLSQADSVISELEENMQLAGDMNVALSTSISETYLNDDEMDAELDSIMQMNGPGDSGVGACVLIAPPRVSGSAMPTPVPPLAVVVSAALPPSVESIETISDAGLGEPTSGNRVALVDAGSHAAAREKVWPQIHGTKPVERVTRRRPESGMKSGTARGAQQAQASGLHPMEEHETAPEGGSDEDVVGREYTAVSV